MTCKITELRRQLETMQSLLDTYEHSHDSVTPEEKVIVNKTKKACIEAVEKELNNQFGPKLAGFPIVIAIKAITDVE